MILKNQMLCILASMKTHFTRNLFHAKTVLFAESERFSDISLFWPCFFVPSIVMQNRVSHQIVCILACTTKENTFCTRKLRFMRKQSNLHKGIFYFHPIFFALNHNSYTEMENIHQIVCTLACTQQNNTFYTENLIHA